MLSADVQPPIFSEAIYYEEGNPQAVVLPEVFVVFGVSVHQRRIIGSGVVIGQGAVLTLGAVANQPLEPMTIDVVSGSLVIRL